MNDESRPKAAPDSAAADHVTTFVEPPATVGAALFLAELDLRAGARLVEWAAVTEPDLSREAKIIFLAAQRVRSRRLAVAA